MASTDDDDAFEEIVRREVPTAPAKALMWTAGRPVLITLGYGLLTLVRQGLAVYGLIVLDNWAVTLTILVVYGLYWGWQLVQLVRGASQIERGSLTHPTPEQREESKRTLDKIGEAPTPAMKWRQRRNLLSALVFCVLAGIGVAGLLNTPAGIIAGMAFFALAVLMHVSARGLSRDFVRPLRLMDPDKPKNTPET